jgi:hypothetical protein
MPHEDLADCALVRERRVPGRPALAEVDRATSLRQDSVEPRLASDTIAGNPQWGNRAGVVKEDRVEIARSKASTRRGLHRWQQNAKKLAHLRATITTDGARIAYSPA